jgi:hypothetical protein
VIVVVAVAFIEPGLAVSDTAIAANVIPIVPVAVESLAAVAVIVTCTSLGGGVIGAVYVTAVDVPLLNVPAPVPGEMLHEVGLTPLFAGSLVTVAVICDVPPAPTGLTVAERFTTMAVCRLNVTDADLVLSATDVAVIVTVTGLDGAVLGAVKSAASPLPVLGGTIDPHGAVEQLTVQVTPLFEESFVTCAVTFTVPPGGSAVVPSGTTLTEIGSFGDPPPLHPDRISRNAKLRSANDRKTLWLIGPPNAKSAQVQIRGSQSPTFTGVRKRNRDCLRGYRI